MRNLTRQYGAVVLSMVFWALSFEWFHIANEAYTPITIVFLRLCLAVGLLSSFLWLSKRFTRIKPEDRKYFFFLAFFEPFLYFLGESFGLTMVSGTVGSVIISTIPVFGVLLAWILYREKLTIINYIGVVISFAGVLIFISDASGSLAVNIKGLLLLTLAVAAAVGYNMILHRLSPKYDPVFIVFIQNAIGVILFLPLFLIFDLKDFINTGIVPRSFTIVVLLAVFASSGAFVLFAYSVRSLGISRANIFSNLIPLFTAVFAFFISDAVPTLRNALGMAIAITGLFLSQRGARKRQQPDDIDLAGKCA